MAGAIRNGEYARDTVKELVQANRLYTGELMVGGHGVDYRGIKASLLTVIAEHDHLVPYEAACPLVANAASTDKEEFVVKGGHVSVIAGAGAVTRMWPKLDDWLMERSI